MVKYLNRRRSINPDVLNNIVKECPKEWENVSCKTFIRPYCKFTFNRKTNDIVEPIAWNRMADKTMVYYTSHRYTGDFDSGPLPIY